jgi:hypothetical protein
VSTLRLPGLLVFSSLLLLPRAAAAEVTLLRWRGTETQGPAPAGLAPAVLLHLGVALKQAGAQLVDAPPYDAEGGARCRFAEEERRAACTVEIRTSDAGARAVRQTDIPFGDAEDLAESLALLATDMLEVELHDAIATPRERRGSPPVAPSPAPRQPSLGRRLPSLGPRRTIIDVGPMLLVGFVGEPLGGGVALRVLQGLGPLRFGGTLSLGGTALQAGGYSLSFLRFVTGPRLGAGFATRWVKGDLVAGPALFVLHTDARVSDGQHTLATFAGALGGRLFVRLRGALCLTVGVEVVIAATEQQVVSGGNELARFGLGSLETALGLGYHP